jgi:hypothetical protein
MQCRENQVQAQHKDRRTTQRMPAARAVARRAAVVFGLGAWLGAPGRAAGPLLLAAAPGPVANDAACRRRQRPRRRAAAPQTPPGAARRRAGAGPAPPRAALCCTRPAHLGSQSCMVRAVVFCSPNSEQALQTAPCSGLAVAPAAEHPRADLLPLWRWVGGAGGGGGGFSMPARRIAAPAGLALAAGAPGPVSCASCPHGCSRRGKHPGGGGGCCGWVKPLPFVRQGQALVQEPPST